MDLIDLGLGLTTRKIRWRTKIVRLGTWRGRMLLLGIQAEAGEYARQTADVGWLTPSRACGGE